MARVDITRGVEAEHIAQAAKAIRDGYVIVAPLESGYVLLADAFFHDAVRALHVLRGDALGVAAQVLIPSAKTLEGITRDITEDVKKLSDAFWPGLLSLALKPQRGLSWDLGDGQRLDQINVRVPSPGFVFSLLQTTGPLAVASVATSGSAPICNPDEIEFGENEVAAIFTCGEITPSAPSTIIECGAKGSQVLRMGALSAGEIKSVVTSISLD